MGTAELNQIRQTHSDNEYILYKVNAMRKIILSMISMFVSFSALALPPDGMVYTLKSSVVKIRVILPNGHYGVGSGVVVAKDQVVTNCHVIANAQAINVIKFGESHRAESFKADWKHDLCIVRFNGLDTAIAKLGSSKQLQYEQPVFTISFPNNSPKPLATYGFVKALYPMDNSFIIRTNNDFRLGASGGPMFSDDGELVGIITLKSPGRNAFYYNTPVEWIQSLLNQPELTIPTKGDLPFWDAPEEKRPFFMRVIQPYQTEDWSALKKISTEWMLQEPQADEALFYLGVAEYNLKETKDAQTHFNQVYERNRRHTYALLYLGLIAAESGNKDEALRTASVLNSLDKDAAEQLNTKLGISTTPNCQTTAC